MKKIFAIFSTVFVMVAISGCATAKYTQNDAYFTSDGAATSIDSDIAFDKAYINAVQKINLKNGITVKSNGLREYNSTNTTKGKDSEAVRYVELLNTDSHMSAYGIKVIKKSHRRVREEGKDKHLWTLVIAVPKENVE